MIRTMAICLLILACCSCARTPSPDRLRDDPAAVTFASSEPTLFGAQPVLTGRLLKPDGGGPFPALVLLHGCGGIQPKRDHLWAERLVGWGYVTLQSDSFGPRKLASACTLSGEEATGILVKRVRDAYDARHYLAGLPFVDRTRIAVMGWSHGAITTLNALYPKREDPFRVAIAMYPSCRKPLTDLNAPLLILIGELDDWTPADRCVRMMPSAGSSFKVALQVYPGAYHGFDMKSDPREVQGSHGSRHHLEYNPAAEKDAIVRVREFLRKYLQQ